MRRDDPIIDLFELKERAEEDQFFAERDRRLIENLRHEHEHEHETTIRELARLRCPQCGQRLTQKRLHDRNINLCPAGHGAWLSDDALNVLASEHGESWLTSFMRGVAHLVRHPYGA